MWQIMVLYLNEVVITLLTDDRCVIETVELEELIKLTVLTASCIMVTNW